MMIIIFISLTFKPIIYLMDKYILIIHQWSILVITYLILLIKNSNQDIILLGFMNKYIIKIVIE